MSEEKRQWRDDPIEKFGDIRSNDQRGKPRSLPTTLPYKQNENTPELTAQREAKENFRIKRTD